ncbi:hypothetical protein RB195_000725 [Necator americanus]|uniref:Transmembrane protein n=1 Tax=Necator americanus TaxID=51031 RepID=A0ABR1DB26_NECAM
MLGSSEEKWNDFSNEEREIGGMQSLKGTVLLPPPSTLILIFSILAAFESTIAILTPPTIILVFNLYDYFFSFVISWFLCRVIFHDNHHGKSRTRSSRCRFCKDEVFKRTMEEGEGQQKFHAEHEAERLHVLGQTELRQSVMERRQTPSITLI